MAATLADITRVANDGDLQARVAACAATKGVAGDPMSWAIQHKWAVATYDNNTISNSYQYAEATKTINVNQATGQRTDSILDSVIEDAVDAIIFDESLAGS